MSEYTLVVGARPNFIKAAPVLRAFKRRNSKEQNLPLRVNLLHTGQHYDAQMSDVFFEQLGIDQPDIYLGARAGTHAQQTARVMETFEEYLLGAPTQRGVIVVGDVNSTLACAITAAKLQIPVAHLEAGLRSFDRAMPEEINRILTDSISDLLLVTEASGIENLRREGIPGERIRYVGNVMIDTVVHELEKAKRLPLIEQLNLSSGEFAMLTLHRPSNVDFEWKLRRTIDFTIELSKRLPLVFPVHPRTRGKLEEFGLIKRLESSPGVRLLEPLGYRENLCLLDAAKMVLTDSGGIQEESSYLAVPCLTLRENTERPVTVSLGTNSLVGTDFELGLILVEQILNRKYKHGTQIPGWDGHAADRVVAAIEEIWENGPAMAEIAQASF